MLLERYGLYQLGGTCSSCRSEIPSTVALKKMLDRWRIGKTRLNGSQNISVFIRMCLLTLPRHLEKYN